MRLSFLDLTGPQRNKPHFSDHVSVIAYERRSDWNILISPLKLHVSSGSKTGELPSIKGKTCGSDTALTSKIN